MFSFVILGVNETLYPACFIALEIAVLKRPLVTDTGTVYQVILLRNNGSSKTNYEVSPI